MEGVSLYFPSPCLFCQGHPGTCKLGDIKLFFFYFPMNVDTFRYGSDFPGHGCAHFVVVLFIVIYVAGFVEVAADGVEDEEEESHDEDAQDHVDCCFT